MRQIILLSVIIPLFSLNAEEKIEYRNVDGFIVFDAAINGKKVQAILDSGSSVNTMGSAFKEAMQNDVKNSIVRLADGSMKNVKTLSSAFSVAGISENMDFKILPIKINESCCDAIIGKPFFDNHRIFVSRETSELIIDGSTPRSKDFYSLPVDPADREIFTTCTINERPALGRLDLGSSQAFDLSGDFTGSEAVSLEPLLQPGMYAMQTKIKCGSISFDENIPSILHDTSNSALGGRRVTINIGAPVLDTYNILFNLPEKEVRLYPRQNQNIRFNKFWMFLTNVDNRIIVKSLLPGGFAAKIGLKIGDEILKINNKGVSKIEDTYSIIENDKLPKKYDLEIKRNGKLIDLSGTVSTLFPDDLSYPSSFYGLDREVSKNVKIDSNIKYNTARIIFYNIKTNFSLSKSMDISNITNLFFNTFKTPIAADDNATYFEGIKLTRNKITVDFENTKPSIYFPSTCHDIKNTIKPLNFYTDNKTYSVIEYKLIVEGCGNSLETHQAVYLFNGKQVLASKSNISEYFNFIKDKETDIFYKWKTKNLTLNVSKSSPSWLIGDLKWAAAQYNKVLSGSFNISIVVSKLEKTSLGDPNVHGVYYFNQDNTGHPFDNETRFATTVLVQNPSTGDIIDGDIIIRESELVQFERIMDGIIKKEMSDKAENLNKKLEAYKEQKLKKTRRNILMHEIGHLLGLGHNFSNETKSIMAYKNLTELTEYDVAALKYLYMNLYPDRPYSYSETMANPTAGANPTASWVD